MNTHDRQDFDDLWLDAALEEVSGRAVPPDLNARIVPREPVGAVPARRASRGVLVGAGVLLLGVVAVTLAWFGRERGSPIEEAGSGTPRGAVKVLYIETTPRWEYRHLKSALLREGARIIVQCFLIDATSGFEQEHSAGVLALTTMPATTEALLGYDVILLGDVVPDDLREGGVDVESFVAALRAVMAQGRGLGVLCGGRGMPTAWSGTRLIDLLAAPGAGVVWQPGDGYPMRPANSAVDHPIVTWNPDGKLLLRDALDGDIHVGATGRLQPREQAGVILTGGPDLPLLCVWAGAAGRSAIIATEDTWRLRKDTGDAVHTALWRNLVFWLAGRI